MSTDAIRPVARIVATEAALLDRLDAAQAEELEARLARRGYEFALARSKRAAKGISGGILTAAMAYRNFNAIPPEADGLALLKVLRRPVCGCIDDTRIDPKTGKPAERAITFGYWKPGFEVTVAYRFGRIPDAADSLKASDLRPIVQAVLDGWMAFCGVKLRLIDDFNSANVRMSDGKVDGGFGTLAYMQLPGPGAVGPGVACEGTFDYDEEWGLRTAAAPQLSGRGIDLFNVMFHEFGHALGLDHEPGQNAEVMNPMYWPASDAFVGGAPWLGPKDTHTAQGTYGPPAVRPTPPPPTDPAPDPSAPARGAVRVKGTFIGSVGKASRVLGRTVAAVDGIVTGEYTPMR